MSDDLSVVCRACQRKVLMKQVKFDDVRKAYVCDACFSSTHRTDKPKSRSSAVDEAEKKVNSLKDSLIKYTCTKCNYHFTRQKGKEISACPYCGSQKLDVLNKDASTIIRDSDKFNF